MFLLIFIAATTNQNQTGQNTHMNIQQRDKNYVKNDKCRGGSQSQGKKQRKYDVHILKESEVSICSVFDPQAGLLQKLAANRKKKKNNRKPLQTGETCEVRKTVSFPRRG